MPGTTEDDVKQINEIYQYTVRSLRNKVYVNNWRQLNQILQSLVKVGYSFKKVKIHKLCR